MRIRLTGVYIHALPVFICHLFLLSAAEKFSNAELNWIIAHDKTQLLEHRSSEDSALRFMQAASRELLLH